MSGGFNDPIIGGGGSLVYPSIHSPNFLTGVRGWSINKNGSAEFNNLTVRNGTFLSGIFLMYSSAIPAKGNLVVAFAPQAGGTDAVGNVYPQGFNFGIWDNTGTLKSHFGIDTSGNLYMADTTGLTRVFVEPSIAAQIFYDTTGQASGHMVQSIASAAGTDIVGNNVGAGFVSYDNTFGGVAQLISAGLSLFSGLILRSQLTQNGLAVFNSHGAQVFNIDAVRDSWYLYKDTGSSTQGALIASAAPAAGTDGFGNTVKPGANAYVTVTGTFAGTYAISLNDQLQTWGATVAALVFQNLTNAANLSPAITAQTHATAGNNINIQSGKSTAGAVGATIQVQDSVSSSTPGGLVDILANEIQLLSTDGNVYNCGELISNLNVDLPVNSTSPTTLFTFQAALAVGASRTYYISGDIRGVNGASGTLQPQTMRIGGTATVSHINVRVITVAETANTTAPPTAIGAIGALNADPNNSRTPALNETFHIMFEGIIVITAGGTITVQAREGLSSSDVSWTAKAFGTFARWRQVT